METISIALLCTVGGIIFSYLSFSRHQKRDIAKDTKEEVSEITKATEELKHVSNGINDIKLDIREMNRNMSNTNEKVIRLEESVKQAHKRLDSLEEIKCKQ